MPAEIGAARDFYRLRITRVEGVDAAEFEWREDILWRAPGPAPVTESVYARVEAVSLDDDDRVIALGVFESDDDAHEALAAAEEDLKTLTRSEFEERYFPANA